MHKTDDIKQVTRKGLITLLVGFIGFVLWSSLVAMDRGVVVTGTLTFQGERKTIVHPHTPNTNIPVFGPEEGSS